VRPRGHRHVSDVLAARDSGQRYPPRAAALNRADAGAVRDQGCGDVSLAAESTANADDYRLETVSGCGHFVADERPDLVRARLVELAEEVGAI
jgi:pimeloyl-ACP methyl ester carboxylesterase